jgi:hypothetical protein
MKYLKVWKFNKESVLVFYLDPYFCVFWQIGKVPLVNWSWELFWWRKRKYIRLHSLATLNYLKSANLLVQVRSSVRNNGAYLAKGETVGRDGGEVWGPGRRGIELLGKKAADLGCGRRYGQCYTFSSGRGQAADCDVGGEESEIASIGDHCSGRLFPHSTEQLPINDFLNNACW